MKLNKIIVLLSVFLLLSACSKIETPKSDFEGEYPVVTMKLATNEIVKIELYPDVAPNTVNNFIHLIDTNFYDGLIFHRVIPGFMVQGGDPNGNGTGGPGYQIKGEFKQNGFENDLKHTKGVLSMARAQHPDSAGSQFFIMVDDAPHLDGAYAAFGKVIEGMDAIDAIVLTDRDANDRPLSDQRIKSMTLDFHDYTPVTPQMIR